MKTATLLLLYTVLLSGKEYLYTLPDDKNELIYDLRRDLKKSENYIYTVSKEVSFEKLFIGFKKALNGGVPVVTVVEKVSGLTERLKLFESYYSFKLKKVESSAILIDGNTLFLFGVSLDDEVGRNFGFVSRVEERKKIEKFIGWFSEIVRKSIESTQ
jgi:hypothetical protein